jgi:membrane protease YdiL (CAAX protease family)
LIGRRFVLRLTAAAALAAAAVLAVVAAGYALFALLSQSLSPAAAAAVTALVFALIAGLGGALLFGRSEDDDRHEDESPGLASRLGDLARERPIMAAAAGIAAGWIFMRNPALATVVAAAFSEKGRDPRRRR